VNYSRAIMLACLIMLSCTNHEKNDIRKIEVYYMGFYIDTYISKSCADLQNMYEQEASTAGKVEIHGIQAISRFEEEFAKLRLREAPDYHHIDVRICCILYGEGNTIAHTISFEQPPLMQIDDKIYERDEEFFSFIVENYLPKEYLALRH